MSEPTIQDALEWLRVYRDDYTDAWDRACINRAIGALMTAESVIPKLEAINAELKSKLSGSTTMKIEEYDDDLLKYHQRPSVVNCPSCGNYDIDRWTDRGGTNRWLCGVCGHKWDVEKPKE